MHDPELLWCLLAEWHGIHIADLTSYANADDRDFYQPDLWEYDLAMALEIADWLDVESLLWLDVESLLVLGGCLDAP